MSSHFQSAAERLNKLGNYGKEGLNAKQRKEISEWIVVDEEVMKDRDDGMVRGEVMEELRRLTGKKG